MKLPTQGWMPRLLPVLLGALVLIGVAFDLMTRSRLSATTGFLCQGEYSDTLQVQSMHSRDTEQSPRAQYSYLVRSSAKYECPFFGPDGKLRRRRDPVQRAGDRLRLRGSRQRDLPVHQRARGRLARGHRHVSPDRRHPRGVQAGRGKAAHRARRARRLRARADRADAGGGRSPAGRRHPQGQPEADRAAVQGRQERGAAPGKRRRGARLPAGGHAGGVDRQGREPVRSRSGAGLGPRRLRHRRAAGRGELGQPGAGGLVQVARPRAGRRVPRRLQGARRAERGGRHRPAHRVHAQEAAHPARAVRRGTGRAHAGRPRAHRGGAVLGRAAAVRLRRPGRAGRGDRSGPALSLLRPAVPHRRSPRGGHRGPAQGRSVRRAGAVLGARAPTAGANGRPRAWAPTSAIC